MKCEDESLGERQWQGKIQVFRQKHNPVLLSLPQIKHGHLHLYPGLCSVWLKLTAWAMAWPSSNHHTVF